MSEERRTTPEMIEGEYEVIEERDVTDFYQQAKEPILQTDPRPPYVTYTLLGINIVVWILMNGIGWLLNMSSSMQLYVFGAKVNWLIAQGQYWRLFTAMFLHIGIAHLIFNSYALYIYGPFVEKLYGKFRFLVIYLFSGLVGSLLSYLLSPNPSAGASGAIFGLMGSLLYFRRKRRGIFQRVFGPSLIFIIVINLIYGFTRTGIDNWGHIGGLIGGLLSGYGLGLFRERENMIKKLLLWCIIILIYAAGLWYGQIKYSPVLDIENARAALGQNDIEAAEEYAKKAYEQRKEDEDLKAIFESIYLKKIQKELDSGDPDQALREAEAFLKYYPEDSNFLYIRAQIYDMAGDYEKALEEYLALARTHRNEAVFWYRAGVSAYRLGDYKASRDYLVKALSIDPGMKEAQELLDRIMDRSLDEAKQSPSFPTKTEKESRYQ